MSLDTSLRILIVESRFYDDIADELLAGAKDALTAHDIAFDVVTVPGAFEIPAAIAMAEDAAHRPMGRAYDGYVALGCVIRGDTTHYDYVCNESARGLMNLSYKQRLAIGYGILTVEDEEQAWVRARRNEGNKGGAVAMVALSMITLRKTLMEGGQ
ncbi:6,7-dimethyl-8-ribityllumazine synthase [Asticcacaulis sp. EMRT-3]|uniref:6,7-dimethyl-8-ribityllumazine synthase n=1 Tax=Asticcacaulis sp. EMRT-3 TaxID=3040349 RepID=UPI0024AFC202|nr:6,7-dimethyl-8-ribityllumazine synthase [Asticcacaulis sp. EMRT-3]MDI7774405.1 6,7-dimethyl-8-ribityllumazine synthase [Asticcacaulis sp. EMRT-3]